MSNQHLPAARRSKLLVRELAEETVVYDEETHRAHCLNRTAALIWKNCDGETAIPEIAVRVGESLSSSVPEGVVLLALSQLAERDLLASDEAGHVPSNLISRRVMLRRVGVAAALTLPLVTTIVAPTPAQAQSPCTETSCPPGTTCQAGVCEPDEV